VRTVVKVSCIIGGLGLIFLLYRIRSFVNVTEGAAVV
jgi:hypothetical protein